MLRIMSALTVTALLSSSPTPAQQPPATRPPAEQMPAPTPTPTTPSPDNATAVALLDRIQKIVDDALAGKPFAKDGAVGTSGSLEDKAGKVTIDRAALDELRAEVSMLKTMLRR